MTEPYTTHRGRAILRANDLARTARHRSDLRLAVRLDDARRRKQQARTDAFLAGLR